MTTRGKTEINTVVREAIREVLANDDFVNQITKTIAEKVEQKLLNFKEIIDKQTKQIVDMENKIDGLEQQRKINNICIYGIPEDECQTSDRDLSAQVISVLNEAGMNLRNENLTTSYRIGLQKNNKNRPRPVIIGLINYSYKLMILKNAKKCKGRRIFLTEDLTKKRRELLSAAKSTLGEKNAWTFNGQIFIKDNGQIKKIFNFEDIQGYVKQN